MRTTPQSIIINLLFSVLVVAILSACGKKSDAPSPEPPVATGTTTNLPAAAASNPGFEKLRGKWLRPDGGYILEIKSATAEGKLDAGYFNPRPINVAKAEASREGGTFKVFVELRDVNYPGSTYTLIHDGATDRLIGIYYQAAQRQNFEVEFVRAPRP